jgi:tRNA threonylcarbamoyladenosine biosynthesis protein TsaE
MAAAIPVLHATSSAQATEALGRALAGTLRPGDTILLFGELGSGKTCLVKGIAAGLGIDPTHVHSPTFIMVNRYDGGRLALHHVDLYRLEAGEDFTDLGLDELFAGDGVTAVEWSERLPPAALPVPRIEVRLAHAGGDCREIRLLTLAAPATE